MLDELRGLDAAARPSAREVWEETVTYFENQVHRMDYPSYVAKGWQIGSGPVESACKTVVGQRLKGAGMRWGEPGSDGVCHLRALFLSEKGQWDAFWARAPEGGVAISTYFKDAYPVRSGLSRHPVGMVRGYL